MTVNDPKVIHLQTKINTLKTQIGINEDRLAQIARESNDLMKIQDALHFELRLLEMGLQELEGLE